MLKLTAEEKEIVKSLNHPIYTAAFQEEWINREDNVFSNAIAALQCMGAKGFYQAVQCMADLKQ